MARLQGRTLFFITSPRTPLKMLPEIKLLLQKFTGQPWNPVTQTSFMECLAADSTFEGLGSLKDPAFSARDRINRGPKALGFIDLKPVIAPTAAGKAFLEERFSEEALLRQLLKFQLPSPYHIETDQLRNVFFVKPYLEIFRLVYTLGHVTFDELMIFGMQLTRYDKFDDVVSQIKTFRKARDTDTRNYKVFAGEYHRQEILKIYVQEIAQGKTQTRESTDGSLAKFVRTKASNMRDYADACFRYLRATGLIAISQRGRFLSIVPEKKEEVEYFLTHLDRNPVFIQDEASYKAYLFDTSVPVLYTDNRVNLEHEALKFGISSTHLSTPALKDQLQTAIQQRKDDLIRNQVKQLKNYKQYADVIQTFQEIQQNNFYDTPLMLEWNTWRAMTMLDGGNIHANLKFDDNGQPMSTASGNMADIICDYDNFSLTVEVTMQSGQRQYEMEGEPVSRHLAKVKKDQNKPAYCFFIAPRINEGCIAHFYTLHLTNISFYGGTSIIIPLELSVFEKMVEQSGKAVQTPTPEKIQQFCEYSMTTAKASCSELEWYSSLKERALHWLCA